MRAIELIVRGRDGSRRTHSLPTDARVTVGRHPTSTIRLASARVSRHHAVVALDGERLSVEDVSRNGTLVGGCVVRGAAVTVPVDTPIVVGEFTLAVTLSPRPEARGPALTARLERPPAEHEGPGLTRELERPARALDELLPPRVDAPPPASCIGEGACPSVDADTRRACHEALLHHLDLGALDRKLVDDPSLRPRVLAALRRILESGSVALADDVDRDRLVGELADEALGLGPLERLLADPEVSEIMVVDASTIYVERGGRLTLSTARFTDDERVRAVIERIVTPLGRRIDESSPIVDARLRDGSRVNAVIRPLALRGSCITIRKFGRSQLTLPDLVASGSLTAAMARMLTRCVVAKKNVLVSGGTGSGKTTLLNVLSSVIPEGERIVTIEDAAELRLRQPHVVSLETRPASLEGRGEYSVRDLVKNALRMRPDRIVVGECRGGEALDMLQAMSTGHDGSLTTTHASSPREATRRLETLSLMAGLDLPARAIREQIASSVHVIVQQSRLADGSRKVTSISEVTGIDSRDGEVSVRPIYEFVRTGTGPDGQVLGEHRATGYLPTFLDAFFVMGLLRPGEGVL